MDIESRIIAGGFAFPECPRWHEGRLWFSDQHDCRVHVLEADGAAVDSFAVEGQPSGLGWLPDGDLLVVSMLQRRLYRRHAGVLRLHAELGALHPGQSNDMVVDSGGRAYVGNIGFDFHAGELFRPTAIALVDPDGTVRQAADDVACPNGSVITPDGSRFIVAESFGQRLTEFDIAPDGTLVNRRVFAELGAVPDGICLDAEGCVWTTLPYLNAAHRVAPGGAVLDRVPFAEGMTTYACMLGGPDGRDLYLACSASHDPHETLTLRSGRIAVARAPAPRAGFP